MRGTVDDAQNEPPVHELVPRARPAEEESADSSADLSAEPAAELPPELPRRRLSIALTTLATLALVTAVYVARPVLMPVTVAVMLQFLLSPFVRFLARRRVPATLASGLVVGGFCFVLALSVYQLSGAATRWAEELPDAIRQTAVKLEAFKRPVEEMSRTAEQVEDITSLGDRRPTIRVEPEADTPTAVFGRVFSVLVDVPIVLVLVFFMLAGYDSLLRKVVEALPRLRDKKAAVEIFRTVEWQISRYVLTVSVINVILGLSIGLALHALGMPNPYLWGAMAALLNFVPYLGAALGVAIVSVVALLTFERIEYALIAPLAYTGLTALEGMLVTPWILGRRFAMTPVVIFVWVLFWAWLWGIPGALLAVPLLVVLLIVARHTPRLALLSDFLARNP